MGGVLRLGRVRRSGGVQRLVECGGIVEWKVGWSGRLGGVRRLAGVERLGGVRRLVECGGWVEWGGWVECGGWVEWG